MFIECYSPLCAYASRFVSSENAEELVQDLMMHIWEEREYLTIETSLKSYLFAAVRNRAFNAIRDRKCRQKAHSTLYEKFCGKFDDLDFCVANELAVRIREAVEELPETYRETFRLSRFGELTNNEVASMQNVSVKTVEYRISQSLKILMTKLKDYL